MTIPHDPKFDQSNIRTINHVIIEQNICDTKNFIGRQKNMQ